MARAFLVLSVSAWGLLKREHEVFARASLKVVLGFAMIDSLLQLVDGHDLHREYRHEPAGQACGHGSPLPCKRIG